MKAWGGGDLRATLGSPGSGGEPGKDELAPGAGARAMAGGSHLRLAWQMGEEEEADDNRFASGDPDELQQKTPTPDLLFQEEDFLAARRSHWGPPGLG